MFRMQVEFYANEELFTKESLEFLKEKFNEEIYNAVSDGIQEPTYIEVEVWPGSSLDEDWIKPEDVFSALVNHFKSDGLTVIVRPDEDKFRKEDYGIPENYMDVYYKYELNKEDYEDEVEAGEFEFGFDIDYLYAYDPDEDEEILAYEIDGAEPVELY